MEKNQSATELLPVMTAELPGNRREVWLHRNIEQHEDEENGTYWTADMVHFITALTEDEITERFAELWEEQTAPTPTIADVVEGMNALLDMIFGGE